MNCPACQISREEHPERFFEDHALCADCEADLRSYIDGLPDSMIELLELTPNCQKPALNIKSGTELLLPMPVVFTAEGALQN